MRLARDQAVVRDDNHLLAPTLLRSQLVSFLYQAVQRGEMTKKDADRHLNYVRGPRMRLLGARGRPTIAGQPRRGRSASGALVDPGDRRDRVRSAH